MAASSHTRSLDVDCISTVGIKLAATPCVGDAVVQLAREPSLRECVWCVFMRFWDYLLFCHDTRESDSERVC